MNDEDFDCPGPIANLYLVQDSAFPGQLRGKATFLMPNRTTVTIETFDVARIESWRVRLEKSSQ